MNEGSREESGLCAHHQERFSVMLRKMCRKYKLLPSSYAITDEVKRIGGSPSGRGGNADVWCGMYRGSKVAVKVLRVPGSGADLANMEMVCPPASFLQHRNLPGAYGSGIGLLPRSGNMEATQTPEPITVGRGNKIFV